MEDRVKQYIEYLEQEEKSEATRRQYRRDILHFLRFVGERELTRELALRYKEELQTKHSAGSVNVKLAALNGFFTFLGRDDLRVKRLRVQ